MLFPQYLLIVISYIACILNDALTASRFNVGRSIFINHLLTEYQNKHAVFNEAAQKRGKIVPHRKKSANQRSRTKIPNLFHSLIAEDDESLPLKRSEFKKANFIRNSVKTSSVESITFTEKELKKSKNIPKSNENITKYNKNITKSNLKIQKLYQTIPKSNQTIPKSNQNITKSHQKQNTNTETITLNVELESKDKSKQNKTTIINFMVKHCTGTMLDNLRNKFLRCNHTSLTRRHNLTRNITENLSQINGNKSQLRNQSNVKFDSSFIKPFKQLLTPLHNPQPVDTKNINKPLKVYKQAHEGNQSFDNFMTDSVTSNANTLLNPHPVQNTVKILTKITDELDNPDTDNKPKLPPGLKNKAKGREKYIPPGHEKGASNKPAGVNYKPDKLKTTASKSKNNTKAKIYNNQKVNNTQLKKGENETLVNKLFEKNSKFLPTKVHSFRKAENKSIAQTNTKKLDLNLSKSNISLKINKTNINKTSKTVLSKYKTATKTNNHSKKTTKTKTQPIALLARIASDMEDPDVITNLVKALGINDMLDDRNETKEVSSGSGDEVSSGEIDSFDISNVVSNTSNNSTNKKLKKIYSKNMKETKSIVND